MTIAFKNPRLKALLSNDRQLTKRYGPIAARKARERMALIKQAENLEHLEHSPGRFHELTGDRAGQFALSLPDGRRLVFEPTAPVLRKSDGGIDRGLTTSVTVLGIVDYHRG